MTDSLCSTTSLANCENSLSGVYFIHHKLKTAFYLRYSVFSKVAKTLVMSTQSYGTIINDSESANYPACTKQVGFI